MKKNLKTNETGRSMVEMLGVLAVMGVLSVGGVAMYTNAMNKYRANELLNESSKRAVVIATQILSGKSISADMINQFDNNGTTFTGVEEVGTNQFKLTLSGVDDDVCTQLKATVGTNTIIQEVGDKCAYLTFNNDLSKGSTSSNTGGSNGGSEQQELETPADPCAGFTATTCTTACTNDNGTAVYTYAKAGAYCSDGVCDGDGNIINVSDIERNCPSGQVYFYDAGEYIPEEDCESKRNASYTNYCFCECFDGPYNLTLGKCDSGCGAGISFNPSTKECCPSDKPNWTVSKCVDCSQGEYKNNSCYCPDGVELMDTPDTDCSNHLA